MTLQELDVRTLKKPEKHPRIFQQFEALPVGESFVLVNDHDPVPLRGEFDLNLAGSYDWEYLEEGPVWRIKITKIASTPLPRVLCDTRTVVKDSAAASGAIWKLEMGRRDLDSNIIHLQPDTGIDAHTGPDLDVILHALDGSGELITELDTVELHPGAIVWLPRLSRRQITAGSQGLTYFSVHQKRQSLLLQPPS